MNGMDDGAMLATESESMGAVSDLAVAERERLSLRERKFARTKLGLLEAMIELLKQKPFDEILVKELCERVEISEATFFNYFPRKSDLLLYYVQTWILEVTQTIRRLSDSGLAAIEAVFDETGRRVVEHPRLMLEIIAYMALTPEQGQCPAKMPEMTRAERLLAFPDVDEIDDIQTAADLDDVFRPPLARAIELGELPKQTDVDAALLALVTLFFGVPLRLSWRDPREIPDRYRQQLHLLWEGLRGGAALQR